MLRNTPKSARLASVNSSITNPISASCNKTFALKPTSSVSGRKGNITIPATVKTIGAVSIVRSSRRDTSA